MSAKPHRIKTFFRGFLGVLMVLAGIMHFVNPDLYMTMMPDYLPWHAGLIAISGVFEILLGVALFVPKARELAGWGVIALLVAVWPANIWMATEGIPPLTAPVAWVRVAFQVVFIYWAWAVTRPDPVARN